jgi:hypothetical protein
LAIKPLGQILKNQKRQNKSQISSEFARITQIPSEISYCVFSPNFAQKVLKENKLFSASQIWQPWVVSPVFDDSVENAVTVLDHRRTGPSDGGEAAEACRELKVGLATAKKKS